MGRAQYLVEIPKVQVSFREFFSQGNVQGDFSVVIVRAQVQVLVQGVLDHKSFVAVQAGPAQLRVQQGRDGQEPLPQRRQERLVHAQLVQQNLSTGRGTAQQLLLLRAADLQPCCWLRSRTLEQGLQLQGKGRRVKVERDGGKHRVIRSRGECSLKTVSLIEICIAKHKELFALRHQLPPLPLHCFVM